MICGAYLQDIMQRNCGAISAGQQRNRAYGNILVQAAAGYIGSHACRPPGCCRPYAPSLLTIWSPLARCVKFGPFVQGDLAEPAEIGCTWFEAVPTGPPVIISPRSVRWATA